LRRVRRHPDLVRQVDAALVDGGEVQRGPDPVLRNGALLEDVRSGIRGR